MNAPVLASQWPQAKFTVAQIWALIEKGVASPDARFELLDGEVRDKSPKGPLHEDVRLAVMKWLATSIHPHFSFLAETTLYLDAKTFVEPDYVVFASALAIKDLTPDKVVLAIEVGHDSWSYDISEKAQRYANHGVQEYWAIHAPSRLTRVHRRASGAGWADVSEHAVGAALTPLCAPGAALVLMSA
jgi:Uma2 family endonuclease